MMRRLVDLALNNRFIVLSIAILLFIWGIISFKKLPVEAYPDVANTWVQVITQWPGRAAEEVEQQVTVPIEIQMNGIPHLEHLEGARVRPALDPERRRSLSGSVGFVVSATRAENAESQGCDDEGLTMQTG